MRSFALASLAAFASATQPHKFFAESNLICSLCTEVMDHSSKGNEAAINALFETFPKLEEKLWKGFTGNHMIENNHGKTCQNLGLCATEDLVQQFLLEEPLESEKIADIVNNANTSWTASKQARFDGASKNELRKMMGTVVDPDWTIKSAPKVNDFNSDDLPVNFDARTAWPSCMSVINNIRDQSNCGSCWAHGTTEAFNDRLCISTGGNFIEILSVSDTTGCCNATQCYSFGCNGGQIGTPWAWFASKGVVTGGNYGDGYFCYDYTMPMCAHHVTAPPLGSCDDIVQVQPACDSTCPTNTDIEYSSDKHFGSSSYSILGEDNIKAEIMTYGSITGAFTVYEDFETYTGGVYVHTTGDELGGHAIKVIGWGTDEASGLDYWLCVNSWNDTWGVDGTFMISIDDSCGMNHQMHAGLV